MKRALRNIILTSLLTLSSIAISSCNFGGVDVCGDEEEVATPVTDNFKLTANYAAANFISGTSGLVAQEVEFVSHTDGDTTNFRPIGGGVADRFRCRYNGVNTPESTGHIEAWGIKASHFTKSRVKNAASIVVVNDINQYGKYDSSGGRNLAFVWYKMKAEDDYRLLNLELVEQGYSKNNLQQDSSLLPGYYDAFKAAFKSASEAKLRVNGQNDCDFDSSSSIVETTIANAKKNFDELGVDDANASSGKKLRITAQITALSGYNFYCRDLFLSDEDTVKGGIYAFTQYKSIDLKVGDVVQFYCKITKYYGNYQLTDLGTNTEVSDYPFKYVARSKEQCEALGYDYDVNPYEIEEASVTSLSSFDPFAGNYVSVPITLSSSEKFYSQSQTSATTFTIFAKCNGIELNIRLQDHPFFNSASAIEAFFKAGHKYQVKCLLGIYQYADTEEGRYQITIPNFRSGSSNYITEYK
ncbi:MAG: thermonuclease family protein [Bacilli bacterium]|nr:thermonuclease family protein [Bacilli bacterium]